MLIYKSWDALIPIIDNVHWPFFFLSALIAVIDNLLVSILFKDILSKHGIHVSFSKIGQMYFFGQMAKYIPGRFWSILYHISFVNKPGSSIAMIFANLDITLLMLLRNTAISLTLISLFNNIALTIFIFILGFSTFIYFSQSYWITDFLKCFSGKFEILSENHKNVKKAIPYSKLLLINAGTWIAFLTANFVFLYAALYLPIVESTLYISYFGLAWVAGVIIFIVPAGMGIREATFIFLAHLTSQEHVAGLDSLMAIAVIYRFWQIVHEIFGFGLGYILKMFSK